MYDLYKTNALVLGSEARGEANKVIHLFTREFGLVHVHAQSIRLVRSKLRYCMEPYSLPRVTLVRGKIVWRLTNAHEILPFLNIRKSIFKKKVAGRIAALLRRLCHGEESHHALFDEIKNGFIFLDQNNVSLEQLKHFEIALVLKILAHLGYLESDNIKTPLESYLGVISEKQWDEELLDSLSNHSHDAIIAINTSLQESQL